MKNKTVKRILALAMMTTLSLSLIAGCGQKKDDGETSASGKSTEFEWWITSTDGNGEYYEIYEENPAVQFINQQYWDVENGGIGTKENGTKLNLKFQVPVTGEEQDYFNTMIATQSYPDVVDLVMSQESPQSLYEGGHLMDITEYVEKYMPNYLAYLDANPEMKPLVQVKGEDGKVHYYAIYGFLDGAADPWEGMCYRRDWVVKYAEPTEYVWDWESDYVKENGHPVVTPLEKAVKENNLEGWKKNEVTSFQADYGEDPAKDYTDNVIFPSGTKDPITISDWEWMFEAFEKAIAERGWTEDSNAYAFTVAYNGMYGTGDLVSSFGGGTGSFYVKDGEVSFDGASDNFKTYVECMQKWNEEGWLDKQFHTRANDQFFSINTAGMSQGKTGMWLGLTANIGTSIRSSCLNEEDQKDAFVMGAALPINDVYGGEEQMYKEPDALYQSSRKSGATGITTKAEGKDLAALFTYLDWTYTEEGARVLRFGLTEEQYNSVELDPDIMEKYSYTCAYKEETGEDGLPLYVKSFTSSDPIVGAMCAGRMDIGIKLTGHSGAYTIDNGTPKVNEEATILWTKYINTGNVLDYISLLNPEEAEEYNKLNTAFSDYVAQNLPNVIQGTMSWEDYVKGEENLNTARVAELLQKYVDMAKTASGN